jgi:hypothetical protein
MSLGAGVTPSELPISMGSRSTECDGAGGGGGGPKKTTGKKTPAPGRGRAGAAPPPQRKHTANIRQAVLLPAVRKGRAAEDALFSNGQVVALKTRHIQAVRRAGSVKPRCLCADLQTEEGERGGGHHMYRF